LRPWTKVSLYFSAFPSAASKLEWHATAKSTTPVLEKRATFVKGTALVGAGVRAKE
jgi:hypothetical protein